MSPIKLKEPIQIGETVYTEIDLSAPVALKLREPVRLGEVEYTKLLLSEPTVGQLDEASAAATSRITANILMISKVCGVPPSMVRAMKQRDYQQAIAFFDAVATAFQPTGATS
jgi:hypothetical protein